MHDAADLLSDEERRVLLEMPRAELAALILSMASDMASKGCSAEQISQGRDFVLRQIGLSDHEMRSTLN